MTVPSPTRASLQETLSCSGKCDSSRLTNPPTPSLPTTKMSTPSFTNFIVKRPWLRRWMEPLSKWYFDNAGYRKLGLR